MRKFSYWLLPLLFAACMKQGDVPVQTIEVSLPASEAPAVRLSEMVSSVECIPLETNDSTLISEPVQIVLQRASHRKAVTDRR